MSALAWAIIPLIHSLATYLKSHVSNVTPVRKKKKKTCTTESVVRYIYSNRTNSSMSYGSDNPFSHDHGMNNSGVINTLWWIQ